MVFYNKQVTEKQLMTEKITDLMMKKNITFDEAKKIIVNNQSSLGDFRIK